MPQKIRQPLSEQPALPLDLGAAAPGAPRERRSRSRRGGERPVQLSLEMAAEDEADGVQKGESIQTSSLRPAAPDGRSSRPRVAEPAVESLEIEAELPEFDPDPFAEIPGYAPSPVLTQEYVLLPASLRGRLDLREFTRFLASLPSVVRDWEGTPEVDEGGVRLSGPEGGAWVYPEASRVRLTTNGVIAGPAGEDLVALCRWLEGRAGMRLYPAGEITGAGVDRSLDPWDTFLGRSTAGRQI